MEPSSAETDSPLKPGCEVKIVGLAKRPELNGCRGRVVKWFAERGRWQVQVDGLAEFQLFKAESLEVLRKDSATSLVDATPSNIGVPAKRLASATTASNEDYAHLVDAAWMAVSAGKAMRMSRAVDLRERLRQTLCMAPPAALPTGDALLAVDKMLQWELQRKTLIDWRDLPRIRADPRLAVWRGDITTLCIAGIVNAANEGGLGCFQPSHRCIDNIIHCAAGPALRSACYEELGEGGKLPTGTAMVTRGFNLPSEYVLHTPGPVGEQPETLARCYRNVLDCCKSRGIRSVAFCCISTGLFGYPADRAAEVAVTTVRSWLDRAESQDGLPPMDVVVFNTFLESDLNIYRSLLGDDVQR